MLSLRKVGVVVCAAIPALGACGERAIGNAALGAQQCDYEVVCGDGIVAPGEACDDANADEADGCTADCRRAAPQVRATMDFGGVQRAAVVADGSLIAAGDWPAQVAVFSADGDEMWRASLGSEDDTIVIEAVLVGAEIVIVGNDRESDVGMIWHFGLDGSSGAVEQDGAGRYYGPTALAHDGGLVLVADGAVERRAPDGAVAWTRAIEDPSRFGLEDLTVTSSDVVFIAGGQWDPLHAAVFRVTADSVETTMFTPPEFPLATFHAVDSTADGGAVAAGTSSGAVVAAMIDPEGEVLWTSTCSTDGAGTSARQVVVTEDRIVIGGSRSKPEPGCTDLCSGAYFTWAQHLALDGTVIGTDAPEAIVAGKQYPYEDLVTLGLAPSGRLVGLVSDGGSPTSMLVSYPW